MQMTKQQQLAATASGNSLLVSAAAGSGKTSVLTERVIKKLTDKSAGIRADRLMILTFTNAAAAEMRLRITSRLTEKVKEDPDNDYLRSQLLYLPAAKISTIHSACLDIVRSNFHLVGLDPSFSIAEEERLDIIKSELLDDFVEKVYERADSDSGILKVIEHFGSGKDDYSLRKGIENMSKALTNLPYPEEFAEFVKTTDGEFIAGKVLDHIQNELTDIISRLERLILAAKDFPKLVEIYNNDTEIVALARKYAAEKNFDALYNHFKSVKFKNHPTKPDERPEEMSAPFKQERMDCKNKFTKLSDKFFYADKQTFCDDRKGELEVLIPFIGLCIEYNHTVYEKCKKLRILSFDDIEKLTLRLLVDGFSDGKPIPTPLAKQMSENIDEIIVDEFQDCNDTQDIIFSVLSKQDKNVFMVGDVKQSIYRFRNAKPEIFIQKQKDAVRAQEGEPLTAPSSVDLSLNFRSHKKILNFVNNVFDPLMTKDHGEIEYRDGHSLFANPDAVKTDKAGVEIHVIPSGEDTDGSLSKTETEAEFVALKIANLIKSATLFDVKQGMERPVKASDIAVLIRNPKKIGAVYENALKKQGISVINNNPTENYLSTLEVRSVLAFLQVIDNPYDEIPLVTLMYSDFFGFTAAELASIRACNRRALFYDAVKEYAKTDAKTKDFIDKLSYLRTFSLTTDVYGIINAVYENTGILIRLSSVPEGDSAKANLMLLSECALQFEKGRYRGLFAFINYIIKLSQKETTIPSAKLKKSGECVSIMSVHKSKGLEFPIVFLVGAGDTIKTVDNSTITIDRNIGVGGYVVDNKTHREFSSPARNLITAHSKIQDVNEYMRLLYVALTRPVSYLYITAAMGVDEIEYVMQSAYRAKGKPAKNEIYSKFGFLKWIMLSAVCTKSAAKLCAFAGVPTDLSTKDDFADIYLHTDLHIESDQDATDADDKEYNFDKEKVKKLITRNYPYQDDLQIPSKLSVYEIKNIRKSETSALSEKRTHFKKPRFLSGVTGADRGNATHTFLQFGDFSKISDMPSLIKEKERLCEYGFITKEQSELVEDEKIINFLKSDVMKKLLDCPTFKEQRFLFTVDACEVIDTLSHEQIIVQGIIDCYFEKDGKAVIIDYKTDTVNSEKQLIERYKAQLDMYESALYRIKGIQTSHKYIYSFCLERFIQV